MTEDDANVNDDSSELAKLAKSLVTDHRFVFKGMENLQNVSRNLFTLTTLYMDAYTFIAKEIWHVSACSHPRNVDGTLLGPYRRAVIEGNTDR